MYLKKLSYADQPDYNYIKRQLISIYENNQPVFMQQQQTSTGNTEYRCGAQLIGFTERKHSYHQGFRNGQGQYEYIYNNDQMDQFDQNEILLQDDYSK